MPKQSSNRFNTLIVMLGTSISRVLGFVRQAVISAMFGGGAVADVLNSVFLIPNNFRKLLAEGALSTAFIPVLTKVKDEKKRAQMLIGSVFSFQLWVLIPLIALCFFFAKPISDLLFHFGAPDSKIVELTGMGQQELATLLFPWMMIYLVFVSFSAIFMAIHNVQGEFTVPSIAPLMFSIAVIVSLFAFSGQIFVWAQVLGVLIGGGLQLLILLVRFNRYGYNPGIQVKFWSNLDFRDLLRVMVPILGSATIFTITETIAAAFASSMKVGSASALTNALIFWQLPLGIFANSISTVFYPKITNLVAKDKKSEIPKTIREAVGMHIYLLIPSMVFLILFALPTIEVGLHRGSFTHESAALASEVLQWYALGIFSMGIMNFFGRSFNALGKTKIPFIASIIVAILDIALSVIVLLTNFGVNGLAIANTVSASVGAIWMFFMLRKEIGSFGGRDIIMGSLKSIIISLPMLGIYFGSIEIFGNFWAQGSTLYNVFVYLLIAIFSVVFVLLLMRVFKIRVFSLLRKGSRDEPAS